MSGDAPLWPAELTSATEFPLDVLYPIVHGGTFAACFGQVQYRADVLVVLIPRLAGAGNGTLDGPASAATHRPDGGRGRIGPTDHEPDRGTLDRAHHRLILDLLDMSRPNFRVLDIAILESRVDDTRCIVHPPVRRLQTLPQRMQCSMQFVDAGLPGIALIVRGLVGIQKRVSGAGGSGRRARSGLGPFRAQSSGVGGCPSGQYSRGVHLSCGGSLPGRP